MISTPEKNGRARRGDRRANDYRETVQLDWDPFQDERGGDGDVRRHRTIWISDLHLGTRGCQTKLLLDFLERNECDALYLVGDVIDGWSLRRTWYWNEEHNRIVQNILEKSTSGTKVVYVCGNHDEFLRSYLGLMFGGVALVDEAVHVTADGRRLLVLHGDRFDVCIRNAPMLAHLGSFAYKLCLVANTWLNFVRRKLGYPYWSLSACLKQKVKEAVSYIDSFEQAVALEARERGCEGVVTGHIHHANIRDVDGVQYLNDGDWVESCTALVEDRAGNLSILDWSAAREGAFAEPARREPALRPAVASAAVGS